MGSLSILFSALILLKSFSTGDTMDIIGGKEAKPHSRPYMAFLVGDKYCGGTLIKSNWVLTAAHCTFNRKTQVILGAHNWKKNETEQQRFIVSRTVKHPEYRKGIKSNDIQLVQLNRAAKLNKFVSVFPLPQSVKDLKAGTMCNTAGWGVTKANSKKPSSVLREANLTIVNRDTCQKIYQKFYPKFVITEDMLCAGPIERRKDDACEGDSGGPLFCNKKLQGIVAFGRECGDPDTPGIYIQLTTKYLKWIQSVIGRAL